MVIVVESVGDESRNISSAAAHSLRERSRGGVDGVDVALQLQEAKSALATVPRALPGRSCEISPGSSPVRGRFDGDILPSQGAKDPDH